jgi:hypothetical protein
VSETSRNAYFVSIALRANNVLRLGFATAALHRRLIRKDAQNRLFLNNK